MKRCFIFPVKMQVVSNIQEEADTCTIIILHCLNIRISLPDASTTIVTSKVTRHRCISTTCMILQGYTLDSFVQHWCGQQKVPFEYNNIGQDMVVEGGGESRQSYTVSQAPTLPVYLCHRNVAPIKLKETSPQVHLNSKQGRERKNCSHALISDMETITCAIYINVSWLQYEFLKKYQSRTNTLNISNDMDISLLPPCRYALKITHK